MTEKVIDVKEAEVKKPEGIKIDHGNAPILTVKFLSEISYSLNKMVQLLEEKD